MKATTTIVHYLRSLRCIRHLGRRRSRRCRILRERRHLAQAWKFSDETLTATSSAAAAAGVGEVDTDPAAVELLLVEACDGGRSLLRGAEGDETEATRATSVTIAHHDRLKRQTRMKPSGHNLTTTRRRVQ